MLTRLEVHGFKNLMGLDVRFGPFTCIAGENGTGKSNVFDAIEFLSHLADLPMLDAAQRVRGASGERVSDPRDLFWAGFAEDERTMTLTAEMLVPRDLDDDLGTPTRASATFLRYSVTIGYAPSGTRATVGRLVLLGEDLVQLGQDASNAGLRFPHADAFEDDVVTRLPNSRGRFLETMDRGDGAAVQVYNDGPLRLSKPRPLDRTNRSVLSTATTDDYPTVLAARREMQSWRRLALEPSALRAPDEFADPQTMEVNGRHLASALHRVAHTPLSNGTIDPERVYARVVDRLADLVEVRVGTIDVDQDEARQVFVLHLSERDGNRLPARSLSEGTLRFLALCLLLEDPEATGLVCMEEPENGIHPAHLPAMMELVTDLAVDTGDAPGPDNPFRQVIVNTHSPGVVQLSPAGDLLLAENLAQPGLGGTARTLHLTPEHGSWRSTGEQHTFSRGDIVEFLTEQPNAQRRLDLAV